MGGPGRMRGPWARVTFLSVLIFFVLPWAGCSSNHISGEPGTINFLIEAMPTNLDPRIGTDAYSAHLDGLIFSSLVAHDASMNIVPDLADSWDTPDPLTYVFSLRPCVKFHDGRPLTSADVKFTFDSILNGEVKTAKRGALRMVASVEAPDDLTVVFHLREPYASFLWNLTRPGVGIVPRGSGPDIAQHPNGTGPFRFVSMATDEEIILERNPNYFGGNGAGALISIIGQARFFLCGDQPRKAEAPGVTSIERIRFRIVPDAMVRALELRKGSADAEINSLTPDIVATLGKEPGIVADEQPGTPITYVAFNFDDPVLAHREVRQALAYATDRATIIRYLLRGQARAASSLLPPNHWAYEPNVKQYDFDPARAEQLLDAAGYRRGPDGVRIRLTLKTSTDESTRLYAAVLADQWKRVGVALELKSLEFATFYADITRGSFQLYTQRWVGGNNDPDMFEYVFSSKKAPPEGANRGHYRNAELDALLDRARVEMDHEKRKAILSEVQKIVAEDEPYINLWYPDNVCVHRARLTGVEIPPGGDYEFLSGARIK
jgi:peptide/nickel transport system substrate-binding protein